MRRLRRTRRHCTRLSNAIALRMPRWGYTLASLLVIGGLFLVAETTPAGAAIIHDHIDTIEGFGKPVAVAVGPAGPEASTTEKNAVYVADEGNSVVARFTSAGTPLPFKCGETSNCNGYIKEGKLTGTPSGSFGESEPKGVAVDDATGEVFVSEKSVVDVFSGEGEYLGQLTGPILNISGLAIYQSAGARGALYVADDEHGAVDVFELEAGGKAKYASQFGGGVLSTNRVPLTVAVDEFTGDAYVGDGGVVDVFEASGMFIEPPWSGQQTPAGSFNGASVGIDPTSDHVYVADRGNGVVDEFGAASTEEFVDRLPALLAGVPVPVAISPYDQDVYVGEYNENTGAGAVEVFGPDLSVPTVSPEPKAVPTPAGVGLEGTVDPEKLTVTSCVFEYGTSTSYGQSIPCEPSLAKISEGVGGTGEGAVTVTADLKGLPPGTPYHFRLVAGSEHGTNPSDDQTFITVGPKFEGESVADVASTSATLNGSVDPNGKATSAYFEYGPEPCAGAVQACALVPAAPGEAIGEEAVPVTVHPQHVQGLSPGTVYHYRVVGVSTLEGTAVTFPGPEATFTTQAAGERTLPDGRAYEMVSPPQKEGAVIVPPGEAGAIQAARDGEKFTYLTNVPTEAGVAGYSNEQQVLSTRTTPGGWATKDLAAPHNGAVGQSDNAGQEYRFFSEDLSSAILQPVGAFQSCQDAQDEPQPCLSEAASEQTAFSRSLYLNGNVDEPCTSSCYTPLATGKTGYANVPAGTIFGQISTIEGRACPPEKFCGPYFLGASPDAQHVIVASRVALTGVAVPVGAARELYEWSEGVPAGEQLQLISVLPQTPEQRAKGEELPANNPILGSHEVEDARGAVTADGSRVFWTNETSSLYMRDLAKGETLQIAGGAVFQDASADGSRVFYSEGGRLYTCEITEVAGRLACKPEELGNERGAVLGASEDGSYVYYASGGDELYMDRHEGGGWKQTAIAQLSSTDEPDWGNAELEGNVAELTARVSPNGEWLTFMSNRDLTGYDSQDAFSGKPDEEVYLYHAGSGSHPAGSLTCASCNPTGARPVGVEYGTSGKNVPIDGGHQVWEGLSQRSGEGWLAADVPGYTPLETAPNRALYQPRYLTNEGRVFFDSRDALVPQDINGTWDVYEYEPVGVPQGGEHPCEASSTSGSVVFEPAHEFSTSEGEKGESGAGCVGLISSGNSAQESAFLDADEGGGPGEHGKPGTLAGNEVFFMTTAKLTPQDFDKSYDVYDAHECTTVSPCIPPPPGAQAECTTAEACRAAPLPEPGIYGAPASATFSGIGNLPAPAAAKPAAKEKAAKCAKGKVRNKKGRCVKKSKAKKRRKL